MLIFVDSDYAPLIISRVVIHAYNCLITNWVCFVSCCPVYMYLQMRLSGLPHMVVQKERACLFKSLLHLRQHQLNTMARAIIAQVVGHCDDEELHRRLERIYEKHELEELFTHSKDGKPPNMKTSDLVEAISRMGGVASSIIPVDDVHDLILKFDPNRDGMDLFEFSEMVQEICEVNMRFTGFETMADLSMTQLYALKVRGCGSWCARGVGLAGMPYALHTFSYRWSHAHMYEQGCAHEYTFAKIPPPITSGIHACKRTYTNARSVSFRLHACRSARVHP